jgi:hypothetical protein
MTPGRRFAFRYGLFRVLLSVLGMGPRFSSVELDDRRLRVRMGLAFRATIPIERVAGARRRSGLVGGIGVHGWAGRWLVNGSVRGLVTLDVDPPTRAFVLLVPARLRELTLSLAEPDALVEALGR